MLFWGFNDQQALPGKLVFVLLKFQSLTLKLCDAVVTLAC